MPGTAQVNPQVKQANNSVSQPQNDEQADLIKDFKDNSNCREFANISFSWVIPITPVLLYYLVVVARAAEINVKCAEVSTKFADPKAVSVFLFFEIEVFVFMGIIAGLWVWLTTKYIANSVSSEGPMLFLKTPKTKYMSDQLMRNNKDVYVNTGIFWQTAVNLYLYSDQNIAKDIMPDYQT